MTPGLRLETPKFADVDREYVGADLGYSGERLASWKLVDEARLGGEVRFGGGGDGVWVDGVEVREGHGCE